MRGEFVFGDDTRDRLADVPHFIDCEDRLILRRWKNAVPYREIAPDRDRDDAGKVKRSFVVDGENARVCVRAPQQFPEEHSRQGDIVGENCGPGYFRIAVDAWKRCADGV